MSEPPILTARDGDVFVLTFNRPERLNAMGGDMFDAAHAALDEAERTGARALVLTGAGRAFNSGADLREAMTRASAAAGPLDMGASLEATWNPLIHRLSTLPIPVVAAVNGPAAGAGVGVALATDFLLMARSAYLLLAFVNIGLIPDAGVSHALPRRVGRQRATEMMMLGERLPAETAAEWGLAYRCVDDAALMDEAMALARRLAAGPTLALARMKATLRAADGADLDATLALERDGQRDIGRTADFGEGVAAFLGKRTAAFTGH